MNYIFVWMLLWNILGLHYSHGDECNPVWISGCMYNLDYDGAYYTIPWTCNNRKVFMLDDNHFLFHIAEYWIARGYYSDDECAEDNAAIGDMRVLDSAVHPGDISNTWNERQSQGGVWWLSVNLQTQCPEVEEPPEVGRDDDLSDGAIAGIAIGCLVFVVAIIICVVCCERHQKHKLAASRVTSTTLDVTNMETAEIATSRGDTIDHNNTMIPTFEDRVDEPPFYPPPSYDEVTGPQANGKYPPTTVTQRRPEKEEEAAASSAPADSTEMGRYDEMSPGSFRVAPSAPTESDVTFYL